jgi:hypothetical protein
VRNPGYGELKKNCWNSEKSWAPCMTLKWNSPRNTKQGWCKSIVYHVIRYEINWSYYKRWKVKFFLKVILIFLQRQFLKKKMHAIGRLTILPLATNGKETQINRTSVVIHYNISPIYLSRSLAGWWLNISVRVFTSFDWPRLLLWSSSYTHAYCLAWWNSSTENILVQNVSFLNIYENVLHLMKGSG